jgi:starvation-inducible DNA-binding protein
MKEGRIVPKTAVSDPVAREVAHLNAPDNVVVAHLQRELANAFVLYMNYKHYHWQSFGPLFRDIHKLFDKMSEEVLETIDPLAERLRMIGQDPVSQPRQIEEKAQVKPSVQPRNLREMVEEADIHLLHVIKDIRAAARASDQENDPGSVDLFSKIVQIHEKHEWFLREILKKSDGLCS